LIKDIDRDPYDGIGKPEQLKSNLQGYWSRRIDAEHRIVYAVEEKQIVYISFRFHYDK
jgi:toxin YoeB